MLTEGLRLGQMFNVVPQWHPLRLAEDFAIADIITGGRMEFGVGRGTVPREAWALGTVVASGDNAMSAEHDRINREIFEESMEVIKLAWSQEQFAYRGKHMVFPPDDVPDRGTMVHDLTLVPRPLRKVDIYQPVTSPETIEYVPGPATRPCTGCRTPTARSRSGIATPRSAKRVARPSGPARTVAWCSTCTSPRHARQALVKGRPGQDEFNKFLSPYGRFSSYRQPDGSKVAFNHCPTVEESNDQKIQIVGSIDDAVDAIGFWRDLLDLKHICFFLDYPGLTREEMNEQMHLVAEEVFPRLGEPIERRPITGSPLV